MLTWLVRSAAVARALSGKMLEKHKVEINPALVHCAVLDQDVDINIVHSYFSEDGWLAVCNTVSMKKFTHQWQCEACHSDLEKFDPHPVRLVPCLVPSAMCVIEKAAEDKIVAMLSSKEVL